MKADPFSMSLASLSSSNYEVVNNFWNTPCGKKLIQAIYFRLRNVRNRPMN